MKKVSLFVLLVVFALSCSDSYKPTYEGIKNIKVKTLTFNKVVVETAIIVNNPNPVGVTLSKSDFEVFVEDVKVADVNQNLGVEIPKNSDFDLPLIISFKPKDVIMTDKGAGLLNLGMDMFKNKTVKLLVDGKLTFNIMDKDFELPITSEDKFKLSKNAQ